MLKKLRSTLTTSDIKASTPLESKAFYNEPPLVRANNNSRRITLKKICIKCKRELDSNNFRISCDGFQRNTCCECEKQRQRKVYHSRKKKKQEFRPAASISGTSRRDMFEKYEQIFAMEQERGISAKAYESLVLASRGRNKGVKGFLDEMTVKPYKAANSGCQDALCEKYQRDIMTLESFGADVDVLAAFADELLLRKELTLKTKSA